MTSAPTGNEDSGEGERRGEWRAPISGRAKVCVDAERIVAGEAVDISNAGVCLTMPLPLKVGGLYPMIIALDSEPALELSVIGRVCFCLERANAFRVGVYCAELGSLLSEARASNPQPTD